MNAFWDHLQRMAQAQLFNGGYRAGPAIRPQASARTAPAKTERHAGTGERRVARLQTAACR
jgi:hypothetical protein